MAGWLRLSATVTGVGTGNRGGIQVESASARLGGWWGCGLGGGSLRARRGSGCVHGPDAKCSSNPGGVLCSPEHPNSSRPGLPTGSISMSHRENLIKVLSRLGNRQQR